MLRSMADQTRGVAGEERYVVLPHRHAEVMRRLGTQPLGVDELEQALAGVERVPAMGVAVHQHSL